MRLIYENRPMKIPGMTIRFWRYPFHRQAGITVWAAGHYIVVGVTW